MSVPKGGMGCPAAPRPSLGEGAVDSEATLGLRLLGGVSWLGAAEPAAAASCRYWRGWSLAAWRGRAPRQQRLRREGRLRWGGNASRADCRLSPHEDNRGQRGLGGRSGLGGPCRGSGS